MQIFLKNRLYKRFQRSVDSTALIKHWVNILFVLDPVAKILTISDPKRGRMLQMEGRYYFEGTFRVCTLP
jgi:hypothetical protein